MCWLSTLPARLWFCSWRISSRASRRRRSLASISRNRVRQFDCCFEFVINNFCWKMDRFWCFCCLLISIMFVNFNCFINANCFLFFFLKQHPNIITNKTKTIQFNSSLALWFVLCRNCHKVKHSQLFRSATMAQLGLPSCASLWLVDDDTKHPFYYI